MVIDYDDLITGDKFLAMAGGPVAAGKIDHWLEYPVLPPSVKVLVTHNGDLSPVGHPPSGVVWFGVNVEPGSQVIPIPLGLENDYIKDGVGKKMEIDVLRDRRIQPTRAAYLSCDPSTHPSRPQAIADARASGFVTVEQSRCPYQEFYRRILDHEFVLAPRGNGLDTVRVWETLYLGRVPVLIRGTLPVGLMDGLPVVWCDSYRDLTLDWLRANTTPYTCPEKLTFTYWSDRIRTAAGLRNT